MGLRVYVGDGNVGIEVGSIVGSAVGSIVGSLVGANDGVLVGTGSNGMEQHVWYITGSCKLEQISFQLLDGDEQYPLSHPVLRRYRTLVMMFDESYVGSRVGSCVGSGIVEEALVESKIDRR